MWWRGNRLLATTAASVVVVACGGGGLEVEQARLGVPTGPNAAVYLTVTSDTPDRLVAAETDSALGVELHETTMNDDGTMSMRPVDDFRVGEGGDLVLKPGGKHLMLVEAQRLQVGDTVELELRFETAGEVVVSVPVVEPQEVLGEGEGDGG